MISSRKDLDTSGGEHCGAERAGGGPLDQELQIRLTVGQVHEVTRAEFRAELLRQRVRTPRPHAVRLRTSRRGHPWRRLKVIATAKGYDAKALRQQLRARGVRALIPKSFLVLQRHNDVF
jgi:hypothetical protein